MERLRKVTQRHQGALIVGVLASLVAAGLIALVSGVLATLIHPSKEEYVKRADEICADTRRLVIEIGLPEVFKRAVNQEVSAPELERQVDRFEEIVRDRVRRLNDLERPDGKAGETAEEFVSAHEAVAYEGLAVIRDAETAVKEGDFLEAAERVDDAADSSRELVSRDEHARELGAQKC